MEKLRFLYCKIYCIFLKMLINLKIVISLKIDRFYFFLFIVIEKKFKDFYE